MSSVHRDRLTAPQAVKKFSTVVNLKFLYRPPLLTLSSFVDPASVQDQAQRCSLMYAKVLRVVTCSYHYILYISVLPREVYIPRPSHSF
jgi:hypothetical protein